MMAFEMDAWVYKGQIMVEFSDNGKVLKTLKYSPDGAEVMAGMMRIKILEAVAEARKEQYESKQ